MQRKKKTLEILKTMVKHIRNKGALLKCLIMTSQFWNSVKLPPYGIYNIFKNQGFVNVGMSCDTAVFAVESIRKWWYAVGRTDYGKVAEIVITVDCGGSNSYRNRLWKHELQQLSNEIEHRLFAYITKNRKGIPLVSTAIVVSLIGKTTTAKGLSVTCVLDRSKYQTGLKIDDIELQQRRNKGWFSHST